MEIERRPISSPISALPFVETKKISWKWRLKVIMYACNCSDAASETKKISWKWRLKDCVWNVWADYSSVETKKISWKWRLKVISIWRFEPYEKTKQRKSPENGDWKSQVFQDQFLPCFRNKENLLKMEIESLILITSSTVPTLETKKISWKWRLKAGEERAALPMVPTRKQRKSPENGDWKFWHFCSFAVWPVREKQRKSPENGDWKGRERDTIQRREDSKQRKSPENGDWKSRNSTSSSVIFTLGNKENLLKMEIERLPQVQCPLPLW